MKYTHEMFNIYNHQNLWQNSFGFFVTNRITNYFTIRPEVDFIGRGTSLKFDDISYKLDVKYLDLRLPIIIFLTPHFAVNPYLFVVPEFCIVRKGEITYNSNKTGVINTNLAKGNIHPYDVCVMGGLGLEIPIKIHRFRFLIAAEAGYSLGLLDTFSDDELEGNAIVLNPSIFNFTPKSSRNNKGIEAAITISLPLSNLRWISKPAPKRSVVKTQPNPKPKPKAEPKPEPELEPELESKSEPEIIEYEIKDCFSFEEMYSFVKQGLDVSDKRICAFDIKFQFGSAQLLHSSEEYLNNVVGMMKAYPGMKIIINGHTDNVGSDDFNQMLSEKRAQSVFDYLVRHGIEANRMTCHGYGLHYPIDTNETDAGRARNRRVEIEVTSIN